MRYTRSRTRDDERVGREVLRRRFTVDVPIEQAWAHLARVEEWPLWAPHIRRVEVVPPGPLGPSSSGALSLRGGLRATFRMAAWDPPHRWAWVGRSGGLTIHYDHRFDAEPEPEPERDAGAEHGGSTAMTWVVGLSGWPAHLARRPFAAVYARNVDRAIPRLQAQLASADRPA